jgi:hypothetical protein
MAEYYILQVLPPLGSFRSTSKGDNSTKETKEKQEVGKRWLII